jgi:hypothetical protein
MAASMDARPCSSPDRVERTQGDGYAEVWALVVDNEVIIDLDNFADAVAQAEAVWSRLFFIQRWTSARVLVDVP